MNLNIFAVGFFFRTVDVVCLRGNLTQNKEQKKKNGRVNQFVCGVFFSSIGYYGERSKYTEKKR